MGDFGKYSHPKASKDYRCEWCYGPIPKGERHANYVGLWEGGWQNWRMHEECFESADHEYLVDGFTPGKAEMPERVRSLAKERETLLKED